MNLFQITEAYRADIAKLEAMEELDADTIRDTMEAIAGPFEDKVRAVAAFIRNLEADAEAKAAAAKTMAQRAKSDANKAERMRDYLLACMDAVGCEKVPGAQFDVKVQINPASLVVDEAKLKFVPAKFFVTIPESQSLDKKAAKEAIEAGEKIEGLSLVRSKRIVIK